MPIQDRKFFIMKHNYEQSQAESRHKAMGDNKNKTVVGDSLNAFAEIAQQNIKNGTNF